MIASKVRIDRGATAKWDRSIRSLRQRQLLTSSLKDEPEMTMGLNRASPRA
jgi:hypothetical protein